MIGSWRQEIPKRSAVIGLAICLFIASAWVAIGATGTAQAAKKSKTPFFAIDKDKIAVPEGVSVTFPQWSPDGKHILFQNTVDGTTWSAKRNGKDVRCITCGHADLPQDQVFFYPFPDNKRLYLTPGLGGLGGVDSGPIPDSTILECAPSLYDCQTHQYLPVDMSEDKAHGYFIVQRRTWHLAPDGEHVGWMEVIPTATLMVVGKLQREADKYRMVEQRIVNPTGPSSPTDTRPEGWANSGQLYELKAFTPDGKSALVVGEPDSNVDVLKINLATGETTRITAGPDWDEDGAISPDNQLYATASWRTRHRLEAFSAIPELPPFVTFPQAAVIAAHYVSTFDGFQCDLSPWLLPASGDAGGKLIGQPLNTYALGSNLTAGNNLIGQNMWSSDSTEVLIQEKLRTRPSTDFNAGIQQVGLAPNRILVDRIARKPTKPVPIVSSDVGAWAPTPADYVDPYAGGVDVTINGPGGGTAHLVVTGTVVTGGTWKVTFDHYSSDGKTFLDGTQDVTFGASVTPLDIDAAITVSGEHTGSLNADIRFDNSTKPNPTHSGTFTAVYDGKTAPLLPEVGSCYPDLPQKNQLRLKAKADGSSKGSKQQVTATVQAKIETDKRPVQGATVKIGGARAETNAKGKAELLVGGHGKRKVVAKAGPTFKNGKGSVRLP